MYNSATHDGLCRWQTSVQSEGAYARDTTETGEANLTARCPISLAIRQIVGCAENELASAFVGRTKASKLKVISRTIIRSLSGHAKIVDNFASVLCARLKTAV